MDHVDVELGRHESIANAHGGQPRDRAQRRAAHAGLGVPPRLRQVRQPLLPQSGATRPQVVIRVDAKARQGRGGARHSIAEAIAG